MAGTCRLKIVLWRNLLNLLSCGDELCISHFVVLRSTVPVGKKTMCEVDMKVVNSF